MEILGRAEILGADDLTIEKITVPEWGGIVCIRGLTGAERDDYEESLYQRTGKGRNTSIDLRLRHARAKLVALCAVDVDGKRLFTHDDVLDLTKKSGKALERLYSKARELSGMTEEDIEELVSDLGSDHSEDSTSD